MKKNKYRSKFEAGIADQLKTAKVRFEYETVKLPFRMRVNSGVCGSCEGSDVYQKRTYTPDFILVDLGLILECKGRLTAADRHKMILVKNEYPEKDIRLVFMANNTLAGKKYDRYSDWATANSFKFCTKEIPSSWLK